MKHRRWHKRLDAYLPTMNRYLLCALFLMVLSIGGGILWMFFGYPPSQPLDTPNAESTQDIAPAEQNTHTAVPLGGKEMAKHIFTEDDLKQPEIKKMMEILDSPEYQAFTETDPAGIGDFFDFFASTQT